MAGVKFFYHAGKMRVSHMDKEHHPFEKRVVRENLYRHVEFFSCHVGERHLWKEGSLERTADYIESAFTSYGYSVWRQTYPCYGKKVSQT